MANSSFNPIIQSVSSVSTNVAPHPLNGSRNPPRRGTSSSWPIADALYPVQACSNASLIAANFFIRLGFSSDVSSLNLACNFGSALGAPVGSLIRSSAAMGNCSGSFCQRGTGLLAWGNMLKPCFPSLYMVESPAFLPSLFPESLVGGPFAECVLTNGDSAGESGAKKSTEGELS